MGKKQLNVYLSKYLSAIFFFCLEKNIVRKQKWEEKQLF